MFLMPSAKQETQKVMVGLQQQYVDPDRPGGILNKKVL